MKLTFFFFSIQGEKLRVYIFFNFVEDETKLKVLSEIKPPVIKNDEDVDVKEEAS